MMKFDSEFRMHASLVQPILTKIFFLSCPCFAALGIQKRSKRIHKLIEHLTPLANEPNVSNFLYDLPKGMGLASNLLDTLIQPEINSILETGIPISEILKEIDFDKIGDNDQNSRQGIHRQDVPRIFDSFKAAARAAAPHFKSLMHNFSKIMDLEEEISDLNIRGSASDLLACKCCFYSSPSCCIPFS